MKNVFLVSRTHESDWLAKQTLLLLKEFFDDAGFIQGAVVEQCEILVVVLPSETFAVSKDLEESIFSVQQALLASKHIFLFSRPCKIPEKLLSVGFWLCSDHRNPSESKIWVLET